MAEVAEIEQPVTAHVDNNAPSGDPPIKDPLGILPKSSSSTPSPKGDPLGILPKKPTPSIPIPASSPFENKFTDVNNLIPGMSNKPIMANAPLPTSTTTPVQQTLEEKVKSGKASDAELAQWYNRPSKDEQAHIDAVNNAKKVVEDVYTNGNIDKTVKNHLVEERQKQQYEQNAGNQKIDATQVVNPLVQKAQREAVENSITQGDIDQYKFDPKNTAKVLARKANEIQGTDPAKANELRASAYIATANKRADATNVRLQMDNYNGILNGTYKYDAEKDRVIKPLGFFDSINKGLTERTGEYDLGHNLIFGSKEENIKRLNGEENKKSKFDNPDIPVDAPGAIGHFLGDQGILTLKGIGGEATNYIAPGIGHDVAMGLTAEEMGTRGYAQGFLNSYTQLKKQLKQDHPTLSDTEIENQAYDKANEYARTSGLLDATMGAILSHGMPKMGGKLNPSEALWSKEAEEAAATLPKVTKTTLQKVGKHIEDYSGNVIKMGSLNSALAGGEQYLKNQAANNAGIKTNPYEGVGEAAKNMFLLHATMAGIPHAIGAAGDALMHPFTKVPEGDISKMATNLVHDGILTPDQADYTVNKIGEYKTANAQIPEHITDPAIRIAIQGKMKEYNELSTQLKGNENGFGKMHEAFHDDIKGRMDKLKNDIGILSLEPEDQVKALTRQSTELQRQLDEDKTARAEGKAPKLDDPDKTKSDLKETNKWLDQVTQKVNDPLYKAAKIIKEGKTKGFTKDMLENAANNDPEKLSGFLKEISEQANDPETYDATVNTYGKKLVDLVQELHPKEILSPKTENNEEAINAQAQTGNQRQVDQTGGADKTTGTAPSISVIKPEENKSPNIVETKASSIKPVSDKIQPVQEFKTMDLGKWEGTPEDDEAKKQFAKVVESGNLKAGETGETFDNFIQRNIPAFEKALKGEENNTTIVTHSSNLKLFKVWDEMGRPEIDRIKSGGDLHNEFAKRYLDTETKNGDLETFKGDKGSVHVIRHGETEDNKMNNFRSGNTNLTDNGIKDAEKSGQKLNEIAEGNVPKIISSELPRAIHSSNIISEQLKSKEDASTVRSNKGQDVGAGQFAGGSEDLSGQNLQQSPGQESEPTDTQQQAGGRSAKKESDAESEKENRRLSGIAQRVQEKLGLREYKKGEGWSKEEAFAFGQAAIAHGIDPDRVATDKNYADLDLDERLAIAQAHHADLVKDMNAAGDNFGTDSKEFTDAAQKVADYQKAIQPLKTKSSKAFTAQQGEYDVDTNSFTSVASKVKENTGQDLNATQTAKVKELTEKNKQLQAKLDAAENKLKEETDKEIGQEKPKAPKKAHEQYVKERKDAFQAARDALKKLRTGESGLGVGVPLVRELSAIAPHIAKIVKSLLEEGVDKLGDIVDTIHDELSKDIIGLRRRDVVDLVGGVYNKKEETSPEFNKYADIKKQSQLVKKLEDLQNGLPEDFDKNKTEQSPEVKKLIEQIKKVKKDLADMGYMAEKKDEPLSPEEKNIRRLEKELDDLKQGIAKQKSPSRDLTDREKELQGQIKDEREKLGLIPSKMEKPLTEKELQEQHEEKVKSLQKQFVDKKDNKFTPEESKSIWNYAKETYLDKGVNYIDMISRVSDDLGLSYEQIANSIVTPKTKRISDAMWKHQYDLQKNRLATQRYVDSQGENAAVRAFNKVSNVVREEVVFGHGGVFIGTHAGMTLMDLPRAKYTFKAFFNANKFAYGKEAPYARAMEGLKHRSNYELAQRAGLKNNPDIINNDAEIIAPLLGRFSESGKRGFNAIKILRQDLFDSHYNSLSAAEKADPKAAESIAKLVNNATGASNLDIPEWVNQVTFAGGMEASRWGKLTRNPIKATETAVRALFNPDKVSVEDKVFAKVWAKRVGTELATYVGLLTANAAIQNLATDDKKKQVNLFDPTQSDWLKMKIGNTTFDFTSGMLSTTHFIEQIAYQSAFDKTKSKKENELESMGTTAFKYGVGKLSPLYGDVAEAALRHDYSGNTLPWSDAKPFSKFNHKLTWAEYAESKLPLPVAEGFKAFYESAQQNGLSKDKVDNILTGLKYGAISGLTGFKGYETTQPSKGGSGGGSGATEALPSEAAPAESLPAEK